MDMDSYDPLRTPNDVTAELVNHVLIGLTMSRVAFLRIADPTPGRPAYTLDDDAPAGEPKSSRVVIAALPDSEEIMVAMEGSGAIFIQRDSNLNPFVFVTAGFQLTAAQIVTKLFVGLASAQADLEARVDQARLKLTHQDRS